MSDIKKLLEELEAAASSRKRPSRSNRTLALREPQTMTFYRYCKARGFHVQDVVDMLVARFLSEVKDDLPSELVPLKGEKPTNDPT